MNYTKTTPTILDFRNDYYNIDCQPVGQRLPVYSKGNAKAIGILSTLLSGFDIGTITMMKLDPDSEYEFESIDGGHRKRALWDYLNNRFKVNGRYFKDLSKEDRENFLNIELSFTVYNKLGSAVKGHIFRTLNKTTDVNFMEMLNSYGDTPIANFVRETVRPVKGIKSEPHSLFNFYTRPSGTFYEYLQFDNDRLKQDHLAARIIYRYVKHGDKTLLGGSADKDVESMYEDESILSIDKKLKEKVKTHFDFLREMSIYRKQKFKSPITQHEFKILSYLYFYLIDTYKTFEIRDVEEFYEEFAKANTKLLNKNGEYGDIIHKRSSYTVPEMFRKYISAPWDTSKVTEATMYLVKEMKNLEDFLLIKDSKRDFSVEDKQAKLAEQDFNCYIDGKPLKWEDAHAGHIRAHAKGGRTEYANLAMIRDTHNRDMGTMDVYDYKKWYKESHQ